MKDDKKQGAFVPKIAPGKAQGDDKNKAKDEDKDLKPAPKSDKDLKEENPRPPGGSKPKVKVIDENTIEKDGSTTYRGPGYKFT